jgi:protein-disulfide isomerase
MDHNDDLWIAERMASLDPPADWRPDAAAGLARVRRLDSAAASRRRVWFALAAVAACAAIAVLVLRPGGEGPGRMASPVVSAGFREVGRGDAPVVAEIYSDYQCTPCASLFLETVPHLVTDYVQTGKLRLLHRDLPLPQHEYSRVAARYANAAGRIGRYELAVDRLFRTQREWGVDGDVEGRLAQSMKPAEMERVRAMVRKGDGDASIEADMEMARADDVRETPAMVVVANGRRRTLAPVPSYYVLKGYLDEVLRSNCREDPKAARC